MANPFRNLLDKKTMAKLPHHARWALTGLAQDFWHDGPVNPFLHIVKHKAFEKLDLTTLKNQLAKIKFPRTLALATPPTPPSFAATLDAIKPETKPAGPVLWHAMPGEIAEKMWGAGFVLPGGNAMLDMLLRPIGLDKQTEVLDFSAGLGGFLNKAATEFGAYVTSLEADPALAIRANERLAEAGRSKVESVAYYTPENFAPAKTVTKVFDCIIAREVFYRLKDKQAFFNSVAVCTQPQAQITFTDYILNPEDRNAAAITAWKKHEENATPLSLVEMAEAWAQAGFKLAVHDDQTHFYRREVLNGLQNLAKFLASGPRPDPETRQDIARRMDLWTHRLAAMEQGLKVFRFYGTKESPLPPIL